MQGSLIINQQRLVKICVLTEASIERVLFGCKHQRKLVAAERFGSPYILELSGVGSAKILKENKLKGSYPNENVGETLQEHRWSRLDLKLPTARLPVRPCGIQRVSMMRLPSTKTTAPVRYLPRLSPPHPLGMCNYHPCLKEQDSQET